MTPYWQSPEGDITVFHARCEDVIAAGLVVPREVALVHGDPAYGVGEQTERAKKGRVSASRAGVAARDWPAIKGDERSYNPLPVFPGAFRRVVLWGANHYASRLPDSPSWILWDKREGTTPDDNADGELAWTNLGGPLRIFRHLWRGLCRASEVGERVLGPCQKPIALCTYVYQRAKLTRGDLVFVPYLGSGPDLPAARAMGLKVVACDVEEWCCRTAVARLGAITEAAAREPVGPLFGAAR